MQKRILGIDYGESKVGIAVSYGSLAEPYRVIKFKKPEELINKIERIVSELDVVRVVLGISEGTMAEKTKKFAKQLEKRLKIPVSFQDETLTTKDAQRLSLEAGIKRKKRKSLEDAYSAALILQMYIDKEY